MGYPDVRPYADVDLTLERAIPPGELAPTQRYLLRPTIADVEALREALRATGTDLFDLNGGLELEVDGGAAVTVIPPIIEESLEEDGQTYRLINDGQHRVYVARQARVGITVVVARGVSPEYPYYAYPLTGGWDDVQLFDELPDGFLKKHYRRPKGYQMLYRDFNAQFPGVQPVRRDTKPPDFESGV